MEKELSLTDEIGETLERLAMFLAVVNRRFEIPDEAVWYLASGMDFVQTSILARLIEMEEPTTPDSRYKSNKIHPAVQKLTDRLKCQLGYGELFEEWAGPEFCDAEGE